MLVRRSLVAALALLPLAMAAHAQGAWPVRPVTLVVHSSPGGGNDIMARNFGPALETHFGVRYAVRNITGGSGAAAAHFMATQAPRDGYTLQLVTPMQLITPLQARGVPTYRQMTPIAGMLMDPTTIYVHRDSPFKTMQDFLAHARKNPRSLAVGIGGAGSLDQLVLQNLMKAAGIEVRMAHHEGGGAAVVALLGRHVDAVVGEPGRALSYLKQGTLRMLGVFQDKRLHGYDAPTLKELGYDVVSAKFRGVFGPPGVPAATVSAIEGALRQVYDVEPFRSYYLNASLDPVFMSSAEFVPFLDRANREFRVFLRDLRKQRAAGGPGILEER
jgi:putative tricarboxylic transport membrane protein